MILSDINVILATETFSDPSDWEIVLDRMLSLTEEIIP